MYDNSLKKQKNNYEHSLKIQNPTVKNNYGIATKSSNNNLSKPYGIETPQKSTFSTGTGQKNFKSSYLNDRGKWSIKAVDDGMVDFDDYISDIKDESTTYPSYNNKAFRVTNHNSNSNYSPSKVSKSDYALSNAEPIEEASIGSGIKNMFGAVSDFVLDNVEDSSGIIGSGTWAARHLGKNVAYKGFEASEDSSNAAIQKAIEWGFNGNAHNNKADAYRHFMWNVKMTRDPEIKYYTARNIANRHEYENIRDFGWLADDSSSFDYKKNNTIIKGKMNQENLMDLWNNQVGRELANNKDFAHMSEEELFDLAIKNDWLITDANNVYDFLGISDYVDSKTVDTEWDLTTGNVTVKKGDKSVTLKIGV